MSNKNVEFVNLSKTFVSGDQNFTALENVNFNINENDFFLSVGPKRVWQDNRS